MVTIHELVEKLRLESTIRDYSFSITSSHSAYDERIFNRLCREILYRPINSLRPESFTGMASEHRYERWAQIYAEQLTRATEWLTTYKMKRKKQSKRS